MVAQSMTESELRRRLGYAGPANLRGWPLALTWQQRVRIQWVLVRLIGVGVALLLAEIASLNFMILAVAVLGVVGFHLGGEFWEDFERGRNQHL